MSWVRSGTEIACHLRMLRAMGVGVILCLALAACSDDATVPNETPGPFVDAGPDVTAPSKS
jgi:hypothetical protein